MEEKVGLCSLLACMPPSCPPRCPVLPLADISLRRSANTLSPLLTTNAAPPGATGRPAEGGWCRDSAAAPNSAVAVTGGGDGAAAYASFPLQVGGRGGTPSGSEGEAVSYKNGKAVSHCTLLCKPGPLSRAWVGAWRRHVALLLPPLSRACVALVNRLRSCLRQANQSIPACQWCAVCFLTTTAWCVASSAIAVINHLRPMPGPPCFAHRCRWLPMSPSCVTL